MVEPNEDPETPLGVMPIGTTPPGTIPKGTTSSGATPAGTTPAGTTPKSTTPKGLILKVPSHKSPFPKILEEQLLEIRVHGINLMWYMTPSGLVWQPSLNLLDVTRKRKASYQPKSSTLSEPKAHKRKRTTPAHWLPQTQPRTTYMVGDKITPVRGLIHKGSMDPAENWRIPSTNLLNSLRDREQHKKKQTKRSCSIKGTNLVNLH